MGNNYQPINNKIVLYATQLSSYSAKVRSYLIKKNIPFEERIPTQKTYKDLIIPRTGGKFIPVVQTPDNILIQDSTTIIQSLEKGNPKNPIYPPTPKQKLASLLIEVYADEWLNIAAMHLRWNYPKSNHNYLIKEYGKILKPNWPQLAQQSAAKKKIKLFPEKLRMLGINAKTKHSIEENYIKFLFSLNNYFKKNKYLMGSRPSIADFSIFGPMFAFFYQDPFAGKIMKKKAPYVNIWVNRMNAKSRTKGNFFAEDKTPKIIDHILNLMSLEQVPVLMETAKILNKWNSRNNYQDLPKTLGTHKFKLNGIESERAVYPYSLWMWQKPYQYYQSLNGGAKAQLNPWLHEVGLLTALNEPLKTNLKKINSHLLIAV